MHVSSEVGEVGIANDPYKIHTVNNERLDLTQDAESDVGISPEDRRLVSYEDQCCQHRNHPQEAGL